MGEAQDGMYIVKDGITYQVTPRIAEKFPIAKKYNLMTGEVIYPTNADHVRGMTDEELAEWATTIGRTFGEEYEGYMSALGWLKAPVEEVDNG